jgi:hypothetical protein
MQIVYGNSCQNHSTLWLTCPANMVCPPPPPPLCCRSVCALHGLVQLEVGCDPLGLTDLHCLNPLSNLKHLALRGLGMEAGGWPQQSNSLCNSMHQLSLCLHVMGSCR